MVVKSNPVVVHYQPHPSHGWMDGMEWILKWMEWKWNGMEPYSEELLAGRCKPPHEYPVSNPEDMTPSASPLKSD